MKKIKYQGGITKLITSKIADNNKKRFAKFVEQNLNSFCTKIKIESINVEVVSFSSSKDFYDQILSILSFLRNIGEPLKWTIYSDGTHEKEQIKLLNTSFNFIKVEMINWGIEENLPINCKKELLPFKSQFLDYVKKMPLGKKLFYYLNHKIKVPTIFLDADVLFYKKAKVLDLILQEDVNGWYLPDSGWGGLDSRYKMVNSEQPYQINSGFFVFKNELKNLAEGLEFLEKMDYKYEYFSEQNIFHILFRANGFMPLDPRIFILDSMDQFDFAYLYDKDKIAIRHYTGPVRHKMWQKDWKWHLSVSE